METMYPALVNSLSTEVLLQIDDAVTTITVRDVVVIPEPPNLLTIGYDTPTPETVLLTEVNGNILTVQRGFEGPTSSWDANTKIARVFTAHDFSSFKTNIEELAAGGGSFTTTDKFIDNEYIYFVGEVSGGWRVNRYDINNNITIANGTIDIPETLGECQSLTYA